MPLNAAQFERMLAGDLPPVMLVASAEPLLLIEAIDAARAAARRNGYAERNVYLSERGFDWNSLESAFGTLSLFSSRRIVELQLPTGRPGKEGGELIERYCANPPPDLLLLISAADWSRKHEAAWVRSIEKAGAFLPLWPLKDDQLLGWLQRRLNSRGLAADAAAIALLVERVEGNLLAAAQEIDKLALLHPGATLDAMRMDDLVADSARFDIFRLCDCALQGDAPRALRMLESLRAEGEAVPALVPILSGQLRQLLQVAEAQQSGANPAQAMRSAGVWDAKQAVFSRALKRGDAAHFGRLIAQCARVERIGKGRESGDAWRELARLLAALAGPRPAQGLLGNTA